MTSTHTDCSLPMHTLAASSASAANRKASAPLSGTEQKLKLSACRGGEGEARLCQWYQMAARSDGGSMLLLLIMHTRQDLGSEEQRRRTATTTSNEPHVQRFRHAP